jgi:catalase
MAPKSTPKKSRSNGDARTPASAATDPDQASLDPAADAMVKATPGYPDVLARTDGTHPVRDTAFMAPYAQAGDRLTTDFGTRVDDTDNSLTVGARGPTLLEDFQLREKIMRFDHERIPERVVHARGVAAHGVFRPYASMASLTSAAFLADPDVPTPVFVRFSTVLGSRGAAETAREVRGFATKFYTSAGNFDLVGNNMPVFFIQDGIKFPDLIHAAKPEPHREIPQAATAHDTFWDFVSLLPESTHHLVWSMSDRAIPRSYRMMEGFGVHTFRLVNAEGATSLVKFHWKPVLGTHSLVWEESQKLGGIDPDFLRRDLYDAIDAGVFPEWELGLQVLPDTEDQMFEGIDLLDATKLVPEELAPVQLVGRLTLDRNVNDYFAETEQVAFCTSHLVPGVEFTDDPLLHARSFSYFDTQLTRLGGPNFEALPINRSRAPVNSMHQDGFGQSAILAGRTRYSPNSLGGGCPFTSTMAEGGYAQIARVVTGAKVRERAPSQPDYFSQATLFWRSLSEVEQEHTAAAFAFELGKVEVVHVRERMLQNLAQVDADLTTRVAAALGMPVPDGTPDDSVTPSPALSQLSTSPGLLDGRVVGVLAGEGVDGAGVAALGAAFVAARARAQVIAPHAGLLTSREGPPVPVTKPFLVSQSVELDVVVVAGGEGALGLAADPSVALYVQEAYRHHKTVAAWGEGVEALSRFGIPLDAAGVVTGEIVDDAFLSGLREAAAWHRHWGRASLFTAAAAVTS